MNDLYYKKLAETSLDNKALSAEHASAVLSSEEIELLPLLNAAYQVRKEYAGKAVTIHIINNAQNGFCPEDCHYCAQAKTSKADIEEFPIKSDAEIMLEAKNAYEKGAHRYCMVFAGRGPSEKRVTHLASLIKEIKEQYPIEICVSAGLLDKEKAAVLKKAGLDRLNHNLNSSSRFYPGICSTHTYEDRINTLTAAKEAGLQLCSGIIVGMGESIEDIIDVAMALREKNVESIPVNFLIPIEGNKLDQPPSITPEFCLRTLCLFRFLNPKAEIRIAAGREYHLKSMEVMALYPANSLFLDGYLNTKGEERARTLQMIKDAGFEIQSEIPIDTLINNETNAVREKQDYARVVKKELSHLRPFQEKQTR